MKLTAIALLTFTLVIGIARSQDSDENDMDVDDMDEGFTLLDKLYILNAIAKGVVHYVLRVLPDVAEVILDKINPAVMEEVKTNAYIGMSGVSSAVIYAPVCINAIMPTELCETFKGCIPETLRRAPEIMYSSPNTTFLEIADECFLPQLVANYGAEYIPDDFSFTAKSILLSMVRRDRELPSQVQSRVLGAIDNDLCRIPEADEPVCERMKLHMCLVDYCVMSMAELDFV